MISQNINRGRAAHGDRCDGLTGPVNGWPDPFRQRQKNSISIASNSGSKREQTGYWNQETDVKLWHETCPSQESERSNLNREHSEIYLLESSIYKNHSERFSKKQNPWFILIGWTLVPYCRDAAQWHYSRYRRWNWKQCQSFRVPTPQPNLETLPTPAGGPTTVYLDSVTDCEYLNLVLLVES